jgi:hypothetical protein
MRASVKRLVALALIAGVSWGAAGLLSSQANARTIVSVGIGGPGPVYGWYGPPPYPYGPPAYYYAPPAPVYVAPATTYVLPAPAPAPAVQAPAPAATWYYCDNPKGYYPYVANCASPWQAVQPTPQ